MKRTIAIAALLAAGCAAWLPTEASAQVGVNIVIGHPPPPPRHEVVPRPRSGYLWAPGYWDWNGRHYVWIGGHWERAHHGEVYRRPEWRHDRDGWRLDRGGWHADARNERRDDRGGKGYDGHHGPDRH